MAVYQQKLYCAFADKLLPMDVYKCCLKLYAKLDESQNQACFVYFRKHLKKWGKSNFINLKINTLMPYISRNAVFKKDDFMTFYFMTFYFIHTIQYNSIA